MSRMRFALAVTAASFAAGAAGCALGLLFAPVSGPEMRRRIAWRAQHECRSMGRSWERMYDRAAERAKHELKARAEKAFEYAQKKYTG